MGKILSISASLLAICLSMQFHLIALDFIAPSDCDSCCDEISSTLERKLISSSETNCCEAESCGIECSLVFSVFTFNRIYISQPQNESPAPDFYRFAELEKHPLQMLRPPSAA